MKKIIYLFVILLYFQNCSFAKEFVDVPFNHWAYKSVDKLTDEQIINGVSDSEFKPEQFITRSEYATMLIKAIGQQNIVIEDMYTFEDVKNTNWAWPYIVRAVNLDILKPADNGYFYPNEYVTRSEIITFLTNILKTEDISYKDAIVVLQNKYIDFDDIPDWFKVTAGKAEYLNVIAQEPQRSNYLDYDKYITRAQMAVFINNLRTKLDEYEQARLLAERSPKLAEGIAINYVYQDGDVVTIPAKTVLPIMISGQISSNESQAGEMFNARFINNIVDDRHQLLFSKDIILIGKILDTTKGKYFLKNGELIFELSAINNNNLLTKILAVAECEAKNIEANKFKKATKAIVKGKNFKAKDGQIVYVRLFKPVRVNVVTGEIFN